MSGPRGSLVIALLFLIGGQLAFIASALSGNRGSVLGALLMLGSVLSVIRMLVELFREGAELGPAKDRKRSSRSRARKRPEGREGAAVSEPVTPTAMLDPDAGVSQLDPEKRRPPHQD